MRHLPQLRIASDGVAEFAPGGMHLMLMQPRAAVEAGGKVEVSFVLDDGRELSAEFEVRNPPALRESPLGAMRLYRERRSRPCRDGRWAVKEGVRHVRLRGP